MDQAKNLRARSFTLSRFALFLLIAVLGVITIILILPDIDLPDTAFHRNTSPLAIRAQSHHAPNANADYVFSGSSFDNEGRCLRAEYEGRTRTQRNDDLDMMQMPLRC
jgi:hypothetical protein